MKGHAGQQSTSPMRLSCALILLLALCVPGSRAQAAQHASDSPRDFIENFYQWYISLINSNLRDRSFDRALKLKRLSFSPELYAILKQTADAQAHCRELITPDFDLLLNTQEPADRYFVGRMTHQGETCLAEIYTERHAEKSEKPEFTAECAEKNGIWFFVNFRFPDGGDVISMLRSFHPPCSRPRHWWNR